MADENIVKHVQDMLKEESWTRAAINNYTKNDLAALGQIVDKAQSEGVSDELQQVCDEHLVRSKDSIIALYISGMISLYNGTLDNSALESLVDIFKKNHKENIVVYLCETILASDENNKFALRTLAECYQSDGDERYWELYERLVKLDADEAELAQALAEHYEESKEDGDAEKAIYYYKKALLRYIDAKNVNAVRETWSKLVQLVPNEIDFFMLAKRNIDKAISPSRGASLMQELCAWYKDNKKWDTAIDILKQILEVDAHDERTRRELVECYRGKYDGKNNLDEYIRSSNLEQSFRNVFEAIKDFEKHISFDVGNFVFHHEWGVGIIQKVDGDMLTINFGKKHGVRKMSLKMAVNALNPLSADHIWVLKATKKPEELKKQVKENTKETLKTIIKSFDNKCDIKRIKAELVPVVLSAGEWTSWNAEAKRLLESDPIFDVDANDSSLYTVRESGVSHEIKLVNEFKAQKEFFSRIDIIMKFVSSDDTDKSSESFNEMLSYITGFLKSISHVDVHVLAAFLTVQKINSILPSPACQVRCTFKDIYDKIEEPRKMYQDLPKDSKDAKLRTDFIKNVRMLPDWDKQFVRLFPTALDGYMLTQLVEAGKSDLVRQLVVECFDNFKDRYNRQAVIYFFRECQNNQCFKDANISYERQLITLINIVELSFREINNHINTTENRKIGRDATQLLFKNDTLIQYMLQKDRETLERLYTLVADIAVIEPAYMTGAAQTRNKKAKDQPAKPAGKKKAKKEKPQETSFDGEIPSPRREKEYLGYSIYLARLRNKILETYPNFKFQEKAKAQQRGLIVTAKKMEEKRAQVEHIQNVEIPDNAKEIGEARARGDLSENAEYKAAREHQHFLNLTLQKLQDEIARAVLFDPSTITTSFVSFSTVVTLHNNDTGADETYTILGPWESDPDNNVISYMSPFGNALMDKKPGDKAVFTINERKCNYTVKEIKAAKA